MDIWIVSSLGFIMNKDAINIHISVFFCGHVLLFLLGKYHRNGITRS